MALPAAKPEDGEAIQTARQDVVAALQQVGSDPAHRPSISLHTEQRCHSHAV